MMSKPQSKTALQMCLDHFRLTNNDLLYISDGVRSSIRKGLNGEPSPFKMLKSYVGFPTGKEHGRYLAVDFGGTNIRILLVYLMANGHYEILRTKKVSLKSDTYDCTTEKTSANDLFDLIANLIDDFSIKENIKLGFTFSYSFTQESLESARLIEWTKDIHISGVVGQDVNLLLKEALARKGLFNIVPVVVINDTVGALLSMAYQEKDVTIASICGTGHNTCYFEEHIVPNTIIDLESGNYDTLSLGLFDDILDQTSENPGRQRLEKAVSGHYIGELFRLACKDLNKNSTFLSNSSISALKTKDAFKAEDLSFILSNSCSNSGTLKKWLEALTSCEVSNHDIEIVAKIAEAIVNRSANIIAATFLGVIKHIDPGFNRHHTIAVDGSLFEKIPNYTETVHRFISLNLKKKATHRIAFTKDGSAIGAAVAAAIASQKNYHCKLTNLD